MPSRPNWYTAVLLAVATGADVPGAEASSARVTTLALCTARPRTLVSGLTSVVVGSAIEVREGNGNGLVSLGLA